MISTFGFSDGTKFIMRIPSSLSKLFVKSESSPFTNSTSKVEFFIESPDKVSNSLMVICLIPVSSIVDEPTSSVASVPPIMTGGIVSVPRP